jgi:signal transduction histidine kinase/ligand-binding sensor domain-containing protein
MTSKTRQRTSETTGRWKLCALSLFFVVFGVSFSAFGQTMAMHQYVHFGWTRRDGVPPNILAVEQTKDGYLWMSTEDGLFRFDGVHFERYLPPAGEKFLSKSVNALKAMPDGGLWIGYIFGGAVLVKDGHLTNYSEHDGLPSASIASFAKDGEGFIWAATTRGLMRLDGSHWRKVGSDWHYPADHATFLLTDTQGTLWVTTEQKLFFLPRGARRFSETTVAIKGLVNIAQAPDGSLWLSTGGVIRRLNWIKNEWRVDGPEIRTQSHILLIDSDGGLWCGSQSAGLTRIRVLARLGTGSVPASSLAIERYTAKDGLTANGGWPVFEDNAGDIWAATDNGIDRFRPVKVNQLPTPIPAPGPTKLNGFTIVVNQRGELLYGGDNMPMRVYNGTTGTRMLGGPNGVVCAYRDPIGALWFGGRGFLDRYSENRFAPVALPSGITAADIVQAIAMDPSGALWVSITRKGVYRLENGVWELYGSRSDLPQLVAITELADSSGRLWFGYTANRIAMLNGNKVQIFSSADGLTTGNLTALHEAGGRVWAGGENGLAYFSQGRFRHVNFEDEEGVRNISGIVGRSNGDLWINQTSGIVHIPAAEIKRILEDPNYRASYEFFNTLDGYFGSPDVVRPLPTAVEGANGRLWFGAYTGIFWIDPDRIRRSPPSPVFVESVVADGKQYSALSDLKMPPNVANLQINYTALDLSVPERVRFRYKLDGVDSDWLDAQTRRQAYYTKLPPGKHTFHVIACNGDGIWNESGATLSFFIAPAFYQTVWFKLALGFAVAGLAWLIHSLRLKQATAQIQVRLAERLEERGRIARELHDTLIQSVDGLMLRVQTALNEPDPTRSRLLIEKALDSAEEVMLEGRERVHALRAEAVAVNELSQALATYGEELAEDRPIAFSVALVGSPKYVDPFVRDETYRIGREALANAFQHAGAAKIEVEVTYDRAMIHMRVRDDGGGIQQETLTSGRPGHWGLRGIRERAQAIGADLVIWSSPGAGTEIDLKIPAEVAYQESTRRFGLFWMKKLVWDRRVAR